MGGSPSWTFGPVYVGTKSPYQRSAPCGGEIATPLSVTVTANVAKKETQPEPLSADGGVATLLLQIQKLTTQVDGWRTQLDKSCEARLNLERENSTLLKNLKGKEAGFRR